MNSIVVELTPDEALVLFSIVQRFSQTGILDAANSAERQALWNLCCLLEKQNLIDSPRFTYDEALSVDKARLTVDPT